MSFLRTLDILLSLQTVTVLGNRIIRINPILNKYCDLHICLSTSRTILVC